MYNVRLMMSKTCNAKYISHLDMFRLCERAVRRAGLPVWYTEGFNPHPYISFLLALPLGVEAVAEPVDIRLNSKMTEDEIIAAFNSVLPRGVKIVGAKEPVMKPAELAFGAYSVLLDRSEITAEELKKALDSGSLTVEKPGKVNGRKTMKTVDASAAVKSYSVTDTDGGVALDVTLPAGLKDNLNPIQLIHAVGKYLGRDITPLKAVRTALKTEDGRDFG